MQNRISKAFDATYCSYRVAIRDAEGRTIAVTPRCSLKKAQAIAETQEFARVILPPGHHLNPGE